MEDDQHDLDLYRFSETIPIVIGKFLAATSYSYLQQPSLSPAPHLPNSPTPKSQVPSSPKSQVQEAGKPWLPWCRWFPLVLHQQPGHHSFMLPHRGTRLFAVRHSAADRSSGSSTLEADWLQLRAASVKIDLQQPRSEVNLYFQL